MKGIAVRACLLILVLVSLCGALAGPRTAMAASAARPARLPWSGYVSTGGDAQAVLVNVRTGPKLSSAVVDRHRVGTPVTVYEVARGDPAMPGNPVWYRVSAARQPGRYIYSGYVAAGPSLVPQHGKLILVSLADQWLIAFQDGKPVLDTPVTTGRPELPTPTGTFHIMARYSPYTFISPWPEGSPYYYAPSPVHYALLFREGGYFIHDAPWRSVFGPGTNLPHDDPGYPLGSHGCVNVPARAAQTLYHWASVGTAVRIVT